MFNHRRASAGFEKAMAPSRARPPRGSPLALTLPKCTCYGDS